MKKRNRFAALIPPMLLWLLLSMLIWSWIFTFLTDTTRDKKIVLFADLPEFADVQLAGRLEQALPAGLTMVQAHPFTYAMLDSGQLTGADLYIIRASQLPEYLDWLAPLPGDFRGGVLWTEAGEPVGLRIYDAAADRGAASAYLTYRLPDGTAEDCYLCFGAQSLHLADGAAEAVASELLTLE